MNTSWIKGAAVGLAVGAVAAMFIGFNWGGWETGGGAKQRADARVLTARAEMCAARVQALPNVAAVVEEAKKVGYSERGAAVKKTGAATWLDMKEPDDNVARACTELLVK